LAASALQIPERGLIAATGCRPHGGLKRGTIGLSIGKLVPYHLNNALDSGHAWSAVLQGRSQRGADNADDLLGTPIQGGREARNERRLIEDIFLKF
jgi:hypothetical protein